MTPRKTAVKKKTAKSAKAATSKRTAAKQATTKKKATRAKTATTKRTAAKKATSAARTTKTAAKKKTVKKAARATTRTTKATKTTKAKATPKVKEKKVLKAAKSPRSTASTSRTSVPASKSAPARPAPVPLNKSDTKFFEQLLIAERERLMKEMGQFEDNVLNRSLRDSSGELSGYSFHMADIGTDSMEREKAFLFASAEGRVLVDVNDALRRLYSGQYGTCESCQGPIGKPRLEVVPHARLCVNCKEIEERRQSGRIR